MDLSALYLQLPLGLRLALQLLTRLPLPQAHDYSEAGMKRSPGWYPAVGFLVGAATAAVFLACALVLPQAVAALIAVGAGLLITGALHEDGLADLCDGIGGARGDRARALAIMRDSRIGTYGALGLGMALALKVAALAMLPLAVVPFALIAGGAVSRAAMSRAMAGADYARTDGAAAALAGEMADAVLQRALITGAAVFVLCWPFLGLAGGAVAAAGLALAHRALRRLYEPRLGGYTGDCLGAVQLTGEVGFLLGLLAASPV